MVLRFIRSQQTHVHKTLGGYWNILAQLEEEAWKYVSNSSYRINIIYVSNVSIANISYMIWYDIYVFCVSYEICFWGGHICGNIANKLTQNQDYCLKTIRLIRSASPLHWCSATQCSSGVRMSNQERGVQTERWLSLTQFPFISFIFHKKVRLAFHLSFSLLARSNQNIFYDKLNIEPPQAIICNKINQQLGLNHLCFAKLILEAFFRDFNVMPICTLNNSRTTM